MFNFNRIVASLFIAAVVPTAAFATNNGPIREIRLSSGGLAEITRALPLSKEGVVRLEVPRDQVDDILKSLMLNSSAACLTAHLNWLKKLICHLR